MIQLGARSALSLYQEVPCVNIDTTRQTDQAQPLLWLRLNQTSYVARVDFDSGSRKPGLVYEGEADVCSSLRSTFDMRFLTRLSAHWKRETKTFSNICQCFKERSARDCTGIGCLSACCGVSQHRLLSNCKAVSGVFDLQISCSL